MPARSPRRWNVCSPPQRPLRACWSKQTCWLDFKSLLHRAAIGVGERLNCGKAKGGEIRMTNDENPKSETNDYLRISGFFRMSAFDIRVSFIVLAATA